MEQAVEANGYDVKKLPLGDLSHETIQKGYEVLSEIEKAINKKQTSLLKDLCGKFYTYIPHNFGRQNMANFIIDTEDKLKDKQELIQKLVGINAANDAIKAKTTTVTTGLKQNPIDQNYDRLNCKMDAISKGSQEYNMIEKYIVNGSRGSNLQMVDCFSIQRDGEAVSFNPKKFGNKQLLWHGSRFSNYVGIITQGLRIAPPEAPHTGYLHGKGIYFAN